ncbi:haloacid dehalogenase-like hydrolase [Candidatus Uhrbacteria bacterium]|nr:haloacid dehalogenase-like hydrolase [Candidatus Uhrbacteria bacterium]
MSQDNTQSQPGSEVTLPSASRHPIAAFDIDGTWYRWQLSFEWINVAVEQGILPRIVLTTAKDVLDAYQSRKVPWSKFVAIQVAAYQEQARMGNIRVSDAELVAKITMDRYGDRVHVFTSRLHTAAKKAGYATAAISGSLQEIVKVFCHVNNVMHHLGTMHPHEDGFYTGGTPIDFCTDKGVAIKKLANEHNLDLSEGIAIGDSETDARMLECVKYPLCMNPNTTLTAIARQNRWPIVIERKDCILYFLPDEQGNLKEVSLSEILPQSVAGHLSSLLDLRL